MKSLELWLEHPSHPSRSGQTPGLSNIPWIRKAAEVQSADCNHCKSQENGRTKISKPDGQHQKARPDQKTGGRKSENRTNDKQKEPLQWRDGLTRPRIPMLLETTSAALHC